MSVAPGRLAFVRTSLARLIENLYREGQIARPRFLRMRQHLVQDRATVRALAAALYGPDREVHIPQDDGTSVCLQLLTLRETSGRAFDLLAFRADTGSRPRPLTCFVGHLPYRTYAELCEHLYRKLPLFLKRHLPA